MSPVAMRKLELHALKRDVDAVLEVIGAAACCELAAPKAETAGDAASPAAASGHAAGEREEIAAAIDRLERIGSFLGFSPPALIPAGTRLPGPEDRDRLETLDRACGELAAEVGRLEARRASVSEAKDEASAFGGLSLPFRELDHLSFLAVRIGSVDPAAREELERSLGDRGLVLPLGASGQIVALASRKGRFALDTELERARFKARDFPPDFQGLPPELPNALAKELAELENELGGLSARKAGLAERFRASWTALSASYAVARSIELVKEGLESSDHVFRLEGWVPRERVASLTKEIGRATDGRVATRVFAPEELPTVRSGDETVPVLLRKRVFVSSFEGIVLSYGAPLYGTVDPTPLVAFFFVLLFSIMFGDAGQGLVILLAGLLLGRSALGLPKTWKKFGPILVAVGIGSTVMGLLEGSFFTDETAFVPLTRAVSAALTGTPVDRFVEVMPTNGVGKLFAFFGFTVGVGAVINSVGLAVNIVNKLRLRKYAEAFLSKTGLAGALFFWWAIGMGARAALGFGPAWFDALGLGLPLAAVVLEPLLARLFERHAGAERLSFLDVAMKGVVELIDSVSYYVSNTMSFLRVGAFALSHAVLSFVVFSMAELVRERAPAGVAFRILVLILGNALILALEGMIVTIQVIRLQYYEFFSKFFTETGKPFSPFKFEYRKE